MALLLAGVTHGQVVVPEGPEFQVSQANGSTTEIPLRPAVAMNADGTFVVVWSSAYEGLYAQPYYTGIRSRRFDADARPRGAEIRVDFDATMTEPFPDVDAAGNGDFIVVWGGDQGIRGRRFASSGESLGGEFQVSSETEEVFPRHAVAADADGNFVVVWDVVERVGTEFDVNLRGRRFAADATPLADEFQVNTYTPGTQTQPDVDAAPDGRFVVVWTSRQDQDLGTARVRGRRFAADGTPAGGEFEVDSMPDQGGAAVAVAADGGFVVVWTSTAYSAYGRDIRGRLFAADATPRSAELEINSSTSFEQFDPSVALDADGNFVAVWTSDELPAIGTPASSHYDIRARQFSSEGVPAGGDFQVNSYTTDRQSGPAIAMTPAGEAVVVWDWRNEINRLKREYKVRGQRLGVRTAATTDFVWSPIDPIAGQSVQFFDVSPGAPTAWSWDFGDGGSSDLRNPAHAYASAGLYTVALTVSGGAAISSASHPVRIFGCHTDSTRMCLANRRFAVEITWLDFRGQRGQGRVVPGVESDNSGIFYFFSPNNWELLVKVLDGCRINDRFWVFAAATTTVQYRMRVTDLESGDFSEYFNPLGTASAAVTDTDAFDTCH